MSGRKGPESRTSERRLTAAERRAAAWELRKRGKTFSEIGKALGVSTSNAHKLVDAVLLERKPSADDVAQQRALMNARLMDGIAATMPGVRRGDVKLMERHVKYEERLAKLNGLDAPAKTEISGPDGGAVPVMTLADLVQSAREAEEKERARELAAGASEERSG